MTGKRMVIDARCEGCGFSIPCECRCHREKDIEKAEVVGVKKPKCCDEKLADYIRLSKRKKEKKAFWFGVRFLANRSREVGLELKGLLKPYDIEMKKGWDGDVIKKGKNTNRRDERDEKRS